MNYKRILNISLFFLVLLIISIPLFVFSSTTYRGVFNANDVNIRIGPGTNYDAIGTANKDTQVNMVDINVYPDESTSSTNKCESGWYRIYLPNNSTTQGYVCKSYLKIEAGVATDKYLRPWMSPKQSIIGGAIFVGESYIAKGQFTSYLKKFNVNPNGSYSVHNHQYMTNIRAPYSEASSTAKSYSQSGMINQPLILSIPVFNNMPEETTLTGYNRSNKGTSEVTDTAFEALLDAQKFPESYKKYLRKLHIDHPNWIFEAMLTGLDWETSVSKQRNVGAIDSTNTAYCDASSGSCIKTEAGWYKPTLNATAYFLDPRNFLDSTYALMFEKLSFSDNIKESDIQYVLNGTFMKGDSAKDNQSYASIFLEAGKIANVNPVYLASLSKQEVGVNGSMATTGEIFTYKDITYQNLYNFYNIGAYSSESSPVRAGLVWASGGSNIPIITGTITGDLIARGYTVNNNIITGINLNASLAVLRGQMPGYDIIIINASGKVLGDVEAIATGSTITITKDDKTENYTVIIYGDITGTGVINSADLLALRQHLLGTKILNGANLTAADINKDGKNNSADLLALRQHLLGTKTISQ